MWVLSIVANSAGSERGFSKFGIFLTKLRNQLSIQKVRKMNTVDMELKRRHEDLGMTTDRIKRKFVRFAEKYAGAESGSMSYDETDSFSALSTQLIRDATDEQGLPVDEDQRGSDTLPSTHPASRYTLKELFQYPEDETERLENGLGFYWQGGVKDLREELELYDLLMEVIDV